MDEELADFIREVLQENGGTAPEETFLQEINVFPDELDEILTVLQRKGYITTMGTQPDRTVYLETPFENAEFNY